MTNQQDLRARIAAAVDYSHNFATAKPNIGRTEKEHILGLVALVREAAAQLGRVDEPAAFAVCGKSDEFGRVLLDGYVGSMDVIGDRVMEAARREGYKGDFAQRMTELGWWIEPLYTRPQLPAGVPPNEMTRTAPERIWLQVSEDPSERDIPFPTAMYPCPVSWCSEQVHAPDGAEVEYVRADLAAAPQPDSQKSGDGGRDG